MIVTSTPKPQWMRAEEPRPVKVGSNMKVLLIAFFENIVSSVNKEYYLELMHRLHQAIRKIGPELWNKQPRILHHSSTPVHMSLLIQKQHRNHASAIVFTELGPLWFFPVRKTQSPAPFATIKAKLRSREELKAIPKSVYQKCFGRLLWRGDEWIKGQPKF